MGEDGSNNHDEYEAVKAALSHAKVAGYQQVCIHTGRNLLAKQVNCEWACHSPPLRAQLATIWTGKHDMESSGSEVIVEHVQREHVWMASELAKHAVRMRTSSAWTLVSA